MEGGRLFLRELPRLSLVALVFCCAGCGREATGVPSMPRGAYQVLSGLADDELGAPVSGARVRITGVLAGSTTSPVVTIAGCSGWRSCVDSLPTTAANGRFEKPVGFGPASAPLCIAVEVFPPAGSPLKNGAAWVPNVFPTGSTDVPDTTRVTVQLAKN